MIWIEQHLISAIRNFAPQSFQSTEDACESTSPASPTIAARLLPNDLLLSDSLVLNKSYSPIARLPDNVLRRCYSFADVADVDPSTRQRTRNVDCAFSPIAILSDDVLTACFSFVGKGGIRYVAGTCRWFPRIYCTEDKQGVLARNERTTLTNVALSVGRAQLYPEDFIDKNRCPFAQRPLWNLCLAGINAGNVAVIDWGRTETRGVMGLRPMDFEPAVRKGRTKYSTGQMQTI